MNLDYSEEQQLLADSVRRYLARDYSFEKRRAIVASAEGWSAQVWAQLAELGVLSLPFSTEQGGFGGGAVDLMGVMEALGEALVVEPVLPALGLAGRLVARAGNDAQRSAVVSPLVEGKLRLAFAHTEADSRYDLARVATRATKSGAGWELAGEKRVVLGAPMAERLVVSATTGSGVSLFLVERGAAGVALAPCRTLDGMRAADIRFTRVRVGAEALVGPEGGALAAIEEATDFATALACAEAVGAMGYANDATLEYLKTRKQFGVPIGTFQALQHRMVDMFVEAEQARSMACLAASKADSSASAAERARAISAAKVRVAEACRKVSQEAVQLHGGMGMSEELKVSHSFRRLTAIAQQFGDVDHHLERFCALEAK